MFWHRITSDAPYEQACKVAIDVDNINQTKAVLAKKNDKTIQLIAESQMNLVEHCKQLEKQVNNLSINRPNYGKTHLQPFANKNPYISKPQERKNTFGNQQHRFRDSHTGVTLHTGQPKKELFKEATSDKPEHLLLVETNHPSPALPQPIPTTNQIIRNEFQAPIVNTHNRQIPTSQEIKLLHSQKELRVITAKNQGT